MGFLLKLLLILDVVLMLALLIYATRKFGDEEKPQETCACPQPEAPAEEVVTEVAEQVVEQVAEPVVEEVVVEPVVEEVVEPVAPVVAEELVISAIEDDDDDRENSKPIPFCEKMLYIDKKTQEYYNALNNEFISYRKINDRISSKGVSYRLGRELVAKITVRGKTMKLHLALPVEGFDKKIFFQKDMSDVKAYAEVPFTVKVKSDRALKNALKLIAALAEAKSIEKKTRYNQVDSIEDLKAIALKNK
jgi:predicted transport protein